MVDFADEDDLYNRVDDLLQALASWTSDGHETLETAYLHLMHKLVKECGILGNIDLQLAKAWVKDLNAIGYVWPKIHKRLSAQTLSSAAVVDQRHLGENSSENIQRHMDDASTAVRAHGDEVAPTHTNKKRYTVGAVVVTRNDGYGGNLVERSTVALSYARRRR